MNNLPSRYRFQIRTCLVTIMALAVVAIIVSLTAELWYRTPPGQTMSQTIPYDWTGRLFGGGLVASVVSFLLLLNLDKNIGRVMNDNGQSYVHIPRIGRKLVARIIWIIIGLVVLWVAGVMILLAVGGNG